MQALKTRPGVHRGGILSLRVEDISPNPVQPRRHFDEAGLRGFLERAWERFRGAGIPPTSGEIDRYTRQQLTRELAALLDSVLPDAAGQG